MSTPPPFDVLTATIKDLQVLLVEKICTSVDLIEIYLVSTQTTNLYLPVRRLITVHSTFHISATRVSYMSNGMTPNLNTGYDREEQQGRLEALCGHRDGPERAALADRSGDG